MKKSIVILVICLAVLGIFFFWRDTDNEELVPQLQPKNAEEVTAAHEARVKIGGQIIFVEIADANEEWIQGLSGRKELAAESGMLFIFNEPGNYGFWMKGMLFPLDIVWISGNKIVDLDENLAPAASDSPPLFYPQISVDKVLEINAGQVIERGIKIGDTVEILLAPVNG